MKETVSKAAHQADGKRRSCDKCPLRPCSNIQFKVCTEQFVEGFRKGAAWQRKQGKNNSNQ
jgi:hypothetical protein